MAQKKSSAKKLRSWEQLHVPRDLIERLWEIARRRKSPTSWQDIAREAIHEKIEREA